MLLARELAELALSLTEGMSGENRFENMVQGLRRLLGCDAASLLMYQGAQFVPLAISGLSPDVMGRRFDIDEHPRLQAIARAGDVVRFPEESELPDPFDGLIPNHDGRLHVHACIGLPLMAGERLIGALTIDAFEPSLSERFSDDALRTISSLAAASLQNALLLERLELRGHDESTVMPSPPQGTVPEIIGESPAINALKTSIEVVADTDLNVLIQGDTGVGKELVARAIHDGSPRNNKPLVYLNCAALPESVAESELFGHVKGAFTGAISNRQGKFELADEGTLFLDEIGELPLGLQAKLLRVIQYGDLQRVGDDTPLKVNVRVIAATNRDLNVEVSEGRFRADLYHRLSVFPLLVPPLSQRGDDVVLLAGFFTERTRAKLHLVQLQLSPEAISALVSYDWPGNVRELEHVIYRAAVLARAQTESHIVQIQTIHLGKIGGYKTGQNDMVPPEGASCGVSSLPAGLISMPLREATDAFQKFRIESTLNANRNNWSATARELGVDAGNLHRLAKRLGLKR